MIFLYAFLLASIIVSPSITANERLQKIVDEAMLSRQGTAVAVDVESGAVIASYRMDVAARRVASPGSAIKPFTLMALLEAGIVKEETALFCPRTVRVGAHNLDCSHPETTSALDPVMALAYSCNNFFIKMSERLPLEALTREFSRAGFATVTGQWATEIPGIVEPVRSRQALQLMGVGEEGIQVTPLALAEAYRNLVRPLRHSESVSPELRLVARGLEAVVKVGTGQLAASKRVQIAGKTGTSGGHAWFAGFAPAEHPEVVVVVFIERGTGGTDAAPIAGRIFDKYFVTSKAP